MDSQPKTPRGQQDKKKAAANGSKKGRTGGSRLSASEIPAVVHSDHHKSDAEVSSNLSDDDVADRGDGATGDEASVSKEATKTTATPKRKRTAAKRAGQKSERKKAGPVKKKNQASAKKTGPKPKKAAIKKHNGKIQVQIKPKEVIRVQDSDDDDDGDPFAFGTQVPQDDIVAIKPASPRIASPRTKAGRKSMRRSSNKKSKVAEVDATESSDSNSSLIKRRPKRRQSRKPSGKSVAKAIELSEDSDSTLGSLGNTARKPPSRRRTRRSR